MKLKHASKWGTRWLTPKAVAKKSKIHDLGVVALRLIKKGEPVGVLAGIVVPKKEIKKYWQIMGHVGIQISNDFFIVPPDRAELEKYGVYNHSCDPNIGFGEESTIFYAIKNIKPGEELVFDYAACEISKIPFRCNCGFKNCRKIIKPTDYKSKKLQRAQGKYFSPFLKSKIKND